MALVRAIVAGDAATAEALLAASPELATAHAERGATRQDAADHYLGAIGHYLYAGDTALHVAAAGHRPDVARSLIRRGADVARPPLHWSPRFPPRNRRGAEPLHYAADGRGSTPLMLATRATGRGGSGVPEAKAQQQEIVRLLEHRVTA
jgi:hypothetical protein